MRKNLSTINDLVKKIEEIYGVPDDRLYDLEDHFYFERKFLLRFAEASDLKEKVKNLLIALAWFLGMVRRFHLDPEDDIFRRYPYKCPFCLSLPCVCKDDAPKKSLKTGRPTAFKPKTIREWQKMFLKIYPKDREKMLTEKIFRTHEDLHHLFRTFRKTLGKTKIKDIKKVTADHFVLYLRLFNVWKKDLGEEFGKLFSSGCYVCHKTPCECFYFE